MIDLTDLGDLYHDFSIFGAKNKQKQGIFKLNQKSKAPILIAYIAWAIAKSPEATFAELFCADAYFAMFALHLGASSSIGIDNNRDGHSDKILKIASRLGLKNFKFILEDINKIDIMNKVDIVANIGGLYHVSNPQEILVKSYDMARKYLIVQSVVSMENNNPNYFVSPAPNWNRGCRFSKASFDKMIGSFGWKIIDRCFNELEGNRKLCSRGSVYYLIEKDKT